MNWQLLFLTLQHLVQKMLHIDPHQRMSLQQVLNHPWIANRDQLPQLRLTRQDASLVKVSPPPLTPPPVSSQLCRLFLVSVAFSCAFGCILLSPAFCSILPSYTVLLSCFLLSPTCFLQSPGFPHLLLSSAILAKSNIDEVNRNRILHCLEVSVTYVLFIVHIV